jgi:hypothetical protein
MEVERRQAALEAWSRSTKGKSDKECDRIADLETSFEDFMADTPAHTLAGVAVKLRLLRRHAADSCSWAPRCLKTALATIAELERLGNGALSASLSPELSALIAKLPGVRASHSKANEVADKLGFGIRDKKKEALARKKELPALRRAEKAALEARRAADKDIVRFPCRTLGDVLAKLHFFAEEEAKFGTPITDPAPTGRLRWWRTPLPISSACSRKAVGNN